MIYTKYISMLIFVIASSLLITACKDDAIQVKEMDSESAVEKVTIEAKKDSEKLGAYIEDSVVTANAKAAILAETGIKSLDISVDTVDGVSTIQGEVYSSIDKESIGNLVDGVDGVKTIDNQLTVSEVKQK